MEAGSPGNIGKQIARLGVTGPGQLLLTCTGPLLLGLLSFPTQYYQPEN